jgi:hypothetical protein
MIAHAKAPTFDPDDPTYQTTAPIPEPFKITWADDAKSLLKSTTVIAGVAGEGEMSVWFGGWGTGKTFLLIDTFWHAGAGQTWNGRRTRQTPVLYVTLEGRRRFVNRIVAARQHHDWPDPWFAYSTVSLDLRTSANDARRLIATAESMMARRRTDHCAMVIDTYSRALGGGSDSDPKDVNPFLDHLGLIIDALPRAHVAIVHHAGKDESRGSRGWSGLIGAADAEMQIKREGDIRTFTITKQRDDLDGTVGAFTLRPFTLGANQFGDPVTSCVVEYLEAQPKKQRLTQQEKLALDQLVRAIADQGKIVPASTHTPDNSHGITLDVWRDYCRRAALSTSDKPDAQRRAFNRASAALRTAGLIGVWTEWVWLESGRNA